MTWEQLHSAACDYADSVIFQGKVEEIKANDEPLRQLWLDAYDEAFAAIQEELFR